MIYVCKDVSLDAGMGTNQVVNLGIQNVTLHQIFLIVIYVIIQML